LDLNCSEIISHPVTSLSSSNIVVFPRRPLHWSKLERTPKLTRPQFSTKMSRVFVPPLVEIRDNFAFLEKSDWVSSYHAVCANHEQILLNTVFLYHYQVLGRKTIQYFISFNCRIWKQQYNYGITNYWSPVTHIYLLFVSCVLQVCKCCFVDKKRPDRSERTTEEWVVNISFTLNLVTNYFVLWRWQCTYRYNWHVNSSDVLYMEITGQELKLSLLCN